MKNPYSNPYIRSLNCPRGRWDFLDAHNTIAEFADTTIIDGVPRWNSNNQVPPNDILELWHYMNLPFDFQKAKAAREADTTVFLDQYRRTNTGRQRTPEELYEMRAAFGSGEVIVNVITGDRIAL